MIRKKLFLKRMAAMSMTAILAGGLVVPMQNVEAEEEPYVDSGLKNVASGIVPTAGWLDGSEMTDGLDGEMDSNSAPRATDGIMTNNFRYGETKPEGTEAKPSYAQFDLKKMYDISSVKMWRYYEDNREYTPTAIAISDSATDWSVENIEVIYNSDAENLYQLGAGEDAGYQETAEGKVFNC